MGLVNRTVPAVELMETTYEYARRLATEIAPSSLASTKLQLYRDLHGDVAAAVTDSATRLEQMMGGPDFVEGVAALTEHRRPRFNPYQA
jgi:enoyl-CoA hydratase/carnithine racemase